MFSFRSPKGYVPSLLHNFAAQATAPIHFKGKQWLLTGVAAGITFLLIENDGNAEDWGISLKKQYNWIRVASPEITKFGDTYGYFTVAGIGILSASFQNKKGVETSLLATQALITSGVWVQLIKRLAGRERPYSTTADSNEEGKQWYGILPLYDKSFVDRKANESFDSFTSGHTDVAFSIATVFASQYNDKPVIPVLCYSAATLVGLSRITEHQHWSSDVFGGALVGYLCGKQVVNHFKKTHPSPVSSTTQRTKRKSEFTLIEYGNQVGFSYRW